MVNRRTHRSLKKTKKPKSPDPPYDETRRGLGLTTTKRSSERRPTKPTRERRVMGEAGLKACEKRARMDGSMQPSEDAIGLMKFAIDRLAEVPSTTATTSVEPNTWTGKCSSAAGT